MGGDKLAKGGKPAAAAPAGRKSSNKAADDLAAEFGDDLGDVGDMDDGDDPEFKKMMVS